MQTITQAAVDKVADAINRARYEASGLPSPKPLIEEDRSAQQYARRLARAAIEAMREMQD